MTESDPGREVLLVVGPPGSGKSTFAAASGLLHVEREQFGSERSFLAAVRTACGRLDARVAVVRCCPSVWEQEEWVLLTEASDVVVLDPGQRECARRLHRRGHKAWRGEVQAAERWHRLRAGETPVVVAVSGVSREW